MVRRTSPNVKRGGACTFESDAELNQWAGKALRIDGSCPGPARLTLFVKTPITPVQRSMTKDGRPRRPITNEERIA